MDNATIQRILALLNLRRMLGQQPISPEGSPRFVSPQPGVPPAIPQQNLWGRIRQMLMMPRPNLPAGTPPIAPPSNAPLPAQGSPWEMKRRNWREYYEGLGKFSNSPEYKRVIAKR